VLLIICRLWKYNDESVFGIGHLACIYMAVNVLPFLTHPDYQKKGGAVVDFINSSFSGVSTLTSPPHSGIEERV